LYLFLLIITERVISDADSAERCFGEISRGSRKLKNGQFSYVNCYQKHLLI